ncbi:MAG: DUF4864 domain-containing protein [Pseudomonadota bacterium]
MRSDRPNAPHAASRRRHARAAAAQLERANAAYTILKLSFGALVVAAFLAASIALADPADPREDAASRAVIEDQLDAFARDAWEEAFAFAGPNIQALFQTPERFGAMVRGGYAMVWRPRSVDFLGAEQVEGGLAQRLRIIDQSGVAHQLRYFLQQVDGAWRIEGVTIEAEPALAA